MNSVYAIIDAAAEFFQGVNSMDDRTLRVLEYNVIIDRLVSCAQSELGKELCAGLKPSTQPDEIKAMLKETSDGVGLIMRMGNPPLSGIHDIRGSLKRAALGSMLSPAELLKTADVLRAARRLKAYVSDDKNDDGGNVVKELISRLQTNKRLEDRINLSIISEEEIADEASRELASIRRKIKDLQNSIRDRLNEIIKSPKYRKFMQDAIVTIRGDRYVIPVRQEYRNEVPGLVHDYSSSGQTLFIEPMAVVEANNSIKQLKIREQAEIERILLELTAEVAQMNEGLTVNVEVLGRLDFIFAKARLSIDLNCVCPAVNTEKRIIIKKGRHPLINPEVVVPIDFRIGMGSNTLIVTGPNTGGKTVTLKTAGLFTLMMQSGLHVPANEGTDLAIFSKVYADIGDEQSIEQSLSTFSSHMKNIVHLLKNSDSNTLVLLDELGAGTDPSEGAALAMAILDKLRDIGAITVATTHYSELKVYGVTTAGVENASCEFDVETLKPTYRLLIGIPGKSNAFAISRRLGLGNDVLGRAQEYLTREHIEFEDVLLSIEKNRSEAEKERMKAASLRMEIENLKKELESQKKKFLEQKDRMLREARENARKILLEARAEADELIAEIRRIQQQQQEIERTKAAEEIRARLRSKISEIEEDLVEAVLPRQGLAEPPKNLKPGDSVLILNLNQKGTVLAPPDKNDEALVQAGILKINVHISNLRLLDEQQQEIQKTGLGRIGMDKARNISTEIDLRGMTLDEAIEQLDKYLDDAALSGLHEVSVIHGKGTGVLRSGIHKYLKSNKRVKSFRLGSYGEGDTGVTFIEL